tara:strand:- start:640 stop:891 length:252 start_codon:yes stop_codon:yes gene_type:complete
MNDIEYEKIKELILEIGEYYKGNDWLLIKKYLLRYLNPEIRKRFSTRDSKTKKHIINDFEKNVIDIYNKIYKVKLVLDETKKL